MAHSTPVLGVGKTDCCSGPQLFQVVKLYTTPKKKVQFSKSVYVVQYLYQREPSRIWKELGFFFGLNLIFSIRWLCVCVGVGKGERSRRLLKQSARTTWFPADDEFISRALSDQRKPARKYITIDIWERERGCIRCVYSIHDEIWWKHKREWRNKEKERILSLSTEYPEIDSPSCVRN